MKIHLQGIACIFIVFSFVMLSCSGERRDNNLYDRDLKGESDTARNYNPPSQVLKGGDSLNKDTINRPDTSSSR